ncbi:MAG: tetratricopeptide repeat protein [Elusimicrobiales bacterium]
MKLLFCFLLVLASAAAPLRAQDDTQQELMRSLLDTFIGSGDFDSAIETASKAAALYPEDPFWLKKRAELALWKSDPRTALASFKKLLSLENTKELRRRVAVLAIGLKDYETALYALELDLAANDLETADDLIYIYEQLGRPEKAAQLIEKYSARFNSPRGYTKAIELFANMGQRQDAERAYKEAISKFGLTPALAQGYAELLSSRMELVKALDLLKKAEPRAKPADTGFWNILGDLAWHFGDIETSVRAARTLDISGKAQEPEYDRLTAYYRAKGLDARAEAAYGKAWARTSKPYFFLAWLGMMAARGDQAGIGAAISSLTPDQELRVGADQYYWSLKALSESAAGHTGGALAAYEAVLRLNPYSEEAKTQLLWFMSSAGLDAQLRERIGPLSAGGSELPEKQLALAYAYLSLEDSQSAASRLAAYSRLRPEGADLELRSDAAETAGYPAAAQDLRFAKWLALDKARRSGSFRSTEDAEAWLRLCARFCAAPRFASELSLLAPALPPEAALNARLARAALHGDADGSFRLGKALKEYPAWLKLSEALTYNQTEELGQLLERSLYVLPFRDRITALERLGLKDEAGAETARLLPQNGSDLFLNLKAAQLLDLRNPSVTPSVLYRKRKALEISGAALTARAPAGESLSLSAGGAALRRSVAAGGALMLGRKEEREAWAGLAWDGRRWDAALKAGGRDAARKFFTAGLEASRELRKGFKTEFSAGYGARADESLNLEAAGLKDFFSAYLSGPLSRPYYFRAGAEAAQFLSQDRVYSGRLNSLRAELSRQGRLSGWALTTRLSYQNTAAAEAPGAKGALDASSPFESTKFLPDSFNQYGAGITLTRDGYRLPLRRLSPYLSADYYYNSSFLGGFGTRAGASCSPWGRNILEAWLEYLKGYKGSGDEVKAAGASLIVYF